MASEVKTTTIPIKDLERLVETAMRNLGYPDAVDPVAGPPDAERRQWREVHFAGHQREVPQRRRVPGPAPTDLSCAIKIERQCSR